MALWNSYIIRQVGSLTFVRILVDAMEFVISQIRSLEFQSILSGTLEFGIVFVLERNNADNAGKIPLDHGHADP